MLSPADISVQHFCTFPHGGAANAAMRLHNGLRKHRVRSQFVYHRNDGTKVCPDATAVRKLLFAEDQRQTHRNGILHWLSNYVSRRNEKNIHRLYHQHIANRPKEFETFAMARLPYATRLDQPTSKMSYCTFTGFRFS